MHWLSVHKKLPQEGDKIITYVSTGSMALCTYIKEKFYDGLYPIGNVTYWCELPPKPKDK